MASIYKRAKVWWISYYQNNERIRKPVGRDKKEALLLKKEIEYKIEKGVQTESETKTNYVSVEKAKAEFFRKISIYVREKTYYNYNSALTPFFSYLEKNAIESIHELDKKVVLDFISERKKQDSKRGGKVRNSTINYELKAIKYFLKICYEKEFIKTNFGREIKPIKVEKKLPFFFNEEHLKMIFGSEEPPYYKKVYIFLLLSGLRVGELCNLEHDDIDLEGRRIFIKEKEGWKPKTGERIVPISEELAQLIESVEKRDKRYIFVNERGKKLNVHSLDTRFLRLKRAIGLKNGTLHTFRHTYATLITIKTGNIRALQTILGHQKIETTQIYSHVTSDHLKDVTDQMKIGLGTILDTMDKKKNQKRRLST
ncbi:MAG: tyrosine-type recombinase/integrase [Candidatus Aminicenantaceae bacterium]